MRTVLSVVAAAMVFGAIAVCASRAVAAQAPVSSIPAGCASAGLKAAQSYGDAVSLISGSRSSAGAVAVWQEAQGRRDGVEFVSQLRSTLRSDAAVDVCQYSGTFHTPLAPPGPGEQERPLPNVLRLLVLDNGDVILDAAGYAGNIELDLP